MNKKDVWSKVNILRINKEQFDMIVIKKSGETLDAAAEVHEGWTNILKSS